MRPSSLQRDVRSDGQTRLAKLSLRKMTCNNFHRVPMIPAKTKARKWTRMLSFGTIWKLNPGFWSSWLTWRWKQHNEGRESGGKGAQKYGRRENVVGETGDSDPLSHPPPPTQKFAPIKNFLVRCLVRCKGCSLVGCVLLRGYVNTAQILHVFLQPSWSEKYLVGLAEAFFIG